MPAVITAQTQSENSRVFRFIGVLKRLIFCSRWQKAIRSLRIVFVTTISIEHTSNHDNRHLHLYKLMYLCSICIQQ